MAQIFEPNYLASPELIFPCTVLSWHCLLHQSPPSPSESPAGLSSLSLLLCSPRPGQIHVENYCKYQTTRQMLPLWNHHSSSVSLWSFLHTSVTACHTVCSQPLAGPPILTHASASHSHLHSQTLWTSSPDWVPRGQLFVYLCPQSKKGQVALETTSTEETDL